MAVSLDLNRVFFEYPFLVPTYFALITRAMIVLEGIAVTGDPAFDLFATAYPYAARYGVRLFMGMIALLIPGFHCSFTYVEERCRSLASLICHKLLRKSTWPRGGK